jgi:hypothetical protein
MQAVLSACRLHSSNSGTRTNDAILAPDGTRSIYDCEERGSGGLRLACSGSGGRCTARRKRPPRISSSVLHCAEKAVQHRRNGAVACRVNKRPNRGRVCMSIITQELANKEDIER